MEENERIALANSVGNDRIFRNGMEENEKYQIFYEYIKYLNVVLVEYFFGVFYTVVLVEYVF
jgi:hypothetical protein